MESTRGEDQIRMSIRFAPPAFRTHRFPASFMGSCFHCKYPRHSQRFCPLIHCSTCGEYGHFGGKCLVRSEMPGYLSPFLQQLLQQPNIYHMYQFNMLLRLGREIGLYPP